MGFLCAFFFLWQLLFVYEKAIFIRLTTRGQVIKMVTMGTELASSECQLSAHTTRVVTAAQCTYTRVMTAADTPLLKTHVQTEG